MPPSLSFFSPFSLLSTSVLSSGNMNYIVVSQSVITLLYTNTCHKQQNLHEHYYALSCSSLSVLTALITYGPTNPVYLLVRISLQLRKESRLHSVCRCASSVYFVQPRIPQISSFNSRPWTFIIWHVLSSQYYLLFILFNGGRITYMPPSVRKLRPSISCHPCLSTLVTFNLKADFHFIIMSFISKRP